MSNFTEYAFTPTVKDLQTKNGSRDGYQRMAEAERIFKLHVVGSDWNCPQHITPRYTREEIGELCV